MSHLCALVSLLIRSPKPSAGPHSEPIPAREWESCLPSPPLTAIAFSGTFPRSGDKCRLWGQPGLGLNPTRLLSSSETGLQRSASLGLSLLVCTMGC